MATAGRERRAERLNQRLRGAQRTNVGDESFSINIDGLDEPPADRSSPARRTPDTSTRKRKRTDYARPQAPQERGSSSQLSTRSAPKDPYDLPDTSKESPGRLASGATRDRVSGGDSVSSARVRRSSSRARHVDQEGDELDSLPAPASVQSPVRSRIPAAILEEVEESPSHAPGSGRRRNVDLSATVGSATRLQDAVGIAPSSSSPLAQKASKSDAAASVPRRRCMGAVSRRSIDDDADELSPDRPKDHTADGRLSDSQPASQEPEPQPQEEVGMGQEAEPSEEEAEEIDATEAAEALGRKRPRKSIRTSSPELGSRAVEAEDAGAGPAPRRMRGRPSKSPAAQGLTVRKPGQKPQKQPSLREKRKRKRSSTSEKPAARQRKSGDGDNDDDDQDDAAIAITVQRFVNNKRRQDDDGSDPLHSEIPFANRSGESVVDVFAQVCQEVVASTLAQFERLADQADNAAKKKELRIKIRAIEAYREELSSRLLQHAIHLNHWYSLRKQVRQAQKEKLSLRDELLRLKGEREQVALRMDAVRIKHEADSKEATHRINTSTLMHDIDLAVEQGREAPELSRAEQKHASLANIELLVAQVSDQASSASSTGGLLRQVQDFNALLERAALALESR